FLGRDSDIGDERSAAARRVADLLGSGGDLPGCTADGGGDVLHARLERVGKLVDGGALLGCGAMALGLTLGAGGFLAVPLAALGFLRGAAALFYLGGVLLEHRDGAGHVAHFIA